MTTIVHIFTGHPAHQVIEGHGLFQLGLKKVAPLVAGYFVQVKTQP
jgi:hypothetical protein